MTLYRAVLMPRGPFISRLQGDTFFGAFCWSYLRRHGQAALEEFLRQCREEGARITFSNAFPAGCLPLPLGVYDPANDFDRLADKHERRDAYRRGKKLKNAKYVLAEAFYRIQAGDWNGFTDQLQGENTVSDSEMHNLVLRDRGLVDRVDGAGNLFSTEARFPDPRLPAEKQAFDLYVLTDLPEREVADTLSLAAALGIGADKSTGHGFFSLTGLKRADARLSSCPGADGFVTLSDFIPAADDPVRGYYRTLIKYSALDREMGGAAPFKRPMLYLCCGGVFYDNPPMRRYGRCVTGVAAVAAPVTVNACCIAAPMRMAPFSG